LEERKQIELEMKRRNAQEDESELLQFRISTHSFYCSVSTFVGIALIPLTWSHQAVSSMHSQAQGPLTPPPLVAAAAPTALIAPQAAAKPSPASRMLARVRVVRPVAKTAAAEIGSKRDAASPISDAKRPKAAEAAAAATAPGLGLVAYDSSSDDADS
jgi:hypothetical protein